MKEHPEMITIFPSKSLQVDIQGNKISQPVFLSWPEGTDILNEFSLQLALGDTQGKLVEILFGN